MREISPSFAERLTAIMPKIIPPPTAGIRDAVADAGDLALPYLKRGQQRSMQKDHYCAQVLIKMATAEAYILLIDYFYGCGSISIRYRFVAALLTSSTPENSLVSNFSCTCRRSICPAF